MRFSANAIVAAAPLLLLSCLNLAAPSAALAQQGMPSDAQIKEQMERQKATFDQAVQRSGKAPKGPTGFKAEVPNITPPPQKKEDIMDVVKKYNDAQAGQRGIKRDEVDLMIFVSLSMPPDVLKELARQAREAGAVMMLRGFKDGKLSETKRAVLAVNRAGAEWDIHPEAFKMFKVKSVPTFVVANAKANSVLDDGCAPETSYASVTGNISVDLALDTLRRRASSEGSRMAEVRIKKLQQTRKTGSIR